MASVTVQHTTTGGSGGVHDAPIPVQTAWVSPFLLMIVWLFVAAAVVGPLIHYFRLVKRSPQVFADDKRTH
ncbi:MAG TPA: hypothetical protein VH253_13090 [Phycisphaerae bacterium]|nr:hypothetical protein [Phycisphaerae bacterium]